MFKVNNKNTMTTSVNFNKQGVLLYLTVYGFMVNLILGIILILH